ncbi:uncharacterized protein [Triticum aestivum]|uniref:uncharacterized protein n=1 Tax=Triticum aestivum TaxID=4565 RepID=UPI001D0171A5|nr:uncharacterized protein LOC123170918 [Triticum aestivum]
MSWTDLPAELLTAIADRIGKHDDFARFRTVCPSWRSAYELLLPAAYYGSEELCRAFRTDRRRMPMSWGDVTDIGDSAVFVDHLRAFCVEADGLNGVRRNCMYVASSYVDADREDGRYNVGVLNLADLTTKRLGMGNLRNPSSTGCYQWPSWSMPNLL